MTRKPDETIQLKLRCREDLRARLASAAAANATSLNSEIVDRLNRSLRIEDELGGPKALEIFRAMRRALNWIEHEVGDWRTSYSAFEAAKVAICKMMDLSKPPYPAEMMEHFETENAAMEAAEKEINELVPLLKSRWPEAHRFQPRKDSLNALMPRSDPGVIVVDKVLDEEELETQIANAGIDAEGAALLRKYHNAWARQRKAHSQMAAIASDLNAAKDEAKKAATKRLEEFMAEVRGRD